MKMEQTIEGLGRKWCKQNLTSIARKDISIVNLMEIEYRDI